MDTLASMTLFVKAMETGSFSATAREVKLTPSAVSKQISRLEDHLGVRLFNRTTRQLSPTEEGRAYYDRCMRILADVEDAEESISNRMSEPRGTLRVATPSAVGRRHIVPLLKRFVGKYPQVRFDLYLSDRPVDLGQAHFDVVIRTGEPRTAGVFARKLADARCTVVATPAYWDRHGRPSTVADLEAHNCLINTAIGASWRLTDTGGREHTLKPTGNIVSDSSESLLEAARAGIGVANLPSWLVDRDVSAGILEEVLADYAQPEPAIYVVCPPGRHLACKVRTFVDFLGSNMGATARATSGEMAHATT